MEQLTFTCPRCGAVSHHPSDAKYGYCGACHWWTGDPVLGPLWTDELERQFQIERRYDE